METRGKLFSPDNLSKDFSLKSKLAQDGVQVLYESIVQSACTKTQKSFEQWKNLFSIVSGYDTVIPSNKLNVLARKYGIKSKVKPAELLFSLQTFFALILKFLSIEVVSSSLNMQSPIKRMIRGPSSKEFKKGISDLESGNVFKTHKITNFLEGDLFSWYLDSWNSSIENFIRNLTSKLSSYNLGSLSDDPVRSRDYLKNLYQELFPKTVRRSLGEYYTPDWLAEYVLERIGYNGNPDKQILDPACGSGTFLVIAINKVRKWYEKNKESCDFDVKDLAEKILRNLVGFDLNPIAVMAARTNFLISIIDLLSHVENIIKIPVYHFDSITTPFEEGGIGRDLKTRTEEKFDFIVGNPPWVNWENLPREYRQKIIPLWQKYDLFRHRGYKARLGAGKDDISILMTYVVHDIYLKETGKLGFILPQTLFKTKGGGEGFRTFKYEQTSKRKIKPVFLKPVYIGDMSQFQPFEGVVNRTNVFICEKSFEPFKYPVNYEVWYKIIRGRISQYESLNFVLDATERLDYAAIPISKKDVTSPWLTIPKAALSGLQKIVGQSPYRAYAGSCTWLNGVYWVQILKELQNGKLIIENLHEIGKKHVEKQQTAIERDLVYPLVRGRDVQRWKATPSAYIIIPNRTDKIAGISEADMKKNYPLTFSYFKAFETQLRQRSGYKLYFKPSDPFWSIYNVGKYSLSPWKAIWREQTKDFKAVVISSKNSKLIQPDHKLMQVPIENEDEAFYLTGLLCSTPSRLLINSYVITTQVSTHILEYVHIPKYSSANKEHHLLVKLSKKCHSAAEKDEIHLLEKYERKIDDIAAKIWGITNSELITIKAALMVKNEKKIRLK